MHRRICIVCTPCISSHSDCDIHIHPGANINRSDTAVSCFEVRTITAIYYRTYGSVKFPWKNCLVSYSGLGCISSRKGSHFQLVSHGAFEAGPQRSWKGSCTSRAISTIQIYCGDLSIIEGLRDIYARLGQDKLLCAASYATAAHLCSNEPHFTVSHQRILPACASRTANTTS